MDAQGAFNQARTTDCADYREEEIYIRLPDSRLKDVSSFRDTKVLKIEEGKTLYGLGEAPRLWYYTCRKKFLEKGFVCAPWCGTCGRMGLKVVKR